MSCYAISQAGFICTGTRPWLRRLVARCPTCECRRELVQIDNGYWGATVGCTGCGDSWDEEGYRQPRPFARGWRQRAAHRFRQLHTEAVYGHPSAEWLRTTFGLPDA